MNHANRGTRVAKFIVSNACDYPVHCSLSVRYTNGVGSFYPRDVSLEAHAVTNITGLAGPPRPAFPRTDAGARQIVLPKNSTSSVTDWTNAWRLTISWRKASPLNGFAETRRRAALWLSEQKFYRLGRYLYPVRIETTETDLIQPDGP